MFVDLLYLSKNIEIMRYDMIWLSFRCIDSDVSWILYPFNGYLRNLKSSVPQSCGPWSMRVHPSPRAWSHFPEGRRGCFWLMVIIRFNDIHIISHCFHILEIIWFLFLILRFITRSYDSYDLCLKCSLCFCNFKGGCVGDGASPFVIGIQNGADHDGICSTSGPSTMTHRRYQIF